MRSTRRLALVSVTSLIMAIVLACGAAEAPVAAPVAPAAVPVAPAPAQQPITRAAPQQPAAPAPAAPALPAQTAPTAPAPVAAAPTAVPTPRPEATDLTWMARYLRGPGYKPEWGEPKSGGILRYGASHTLIGHDPGYGHSFEGPQFLPTYNALLRFDPWVGVSGQIEGDLAETWDMSGNGTTVTFKLREGVKFQNNPNLPAAVTGVSGDEFTCEDALASLEYAVNPAEERVRTLKTGPRSALTHLKGTSCPEGPLGYVFKVDLKEPLARTITMFAGGRGMPNNMDKDFIEWLESECGLCMNDTTPETFLYGTGTGAFSPIEFQSDVVSRVEANPDYFREGLPLLDGMDHFIMKDGTTRFASLVTGQIDYFGEGSASLLPAQVAQVQRSFVNEIVIEPVAHSWGKGLQLNMNRAPFENVNVRKALHLAIDRDEWVDFTLAGTLPGVIRPTNWMPPGTIWALPNDEIMSLPGWRQGAGKVEDIAEANRLLDEVFGKDARFSFSCMAQSSQIYLDGCLFIKDQLARNVDVEVTIDAVESAVQTERYIAENYDTHYGSKVTTVVGDPDDYYMISLVPEFESKYYQVTGAEIAEPAGLAAELEAMARAQSKELDVLKRQQMVYEIERKLATEAFYLIPFPWSNVFPAWRADVKGWTLGPFPSQVKWAQWERVWLDR